MLIDGTNASDDAGNRPGMRVLREFRVHSPLWECELAKQQIRGLSREAGLFTGDEPACACPTTRVPTGEAIAAGKPEWTEKTKIPYVSGLRISASGRFAAPLAILPLYQYVGCLVTGTGVAPLSATTSMDHAGTSLVF